MVGQGFVGGAIVSSFVGGAVREWTRVRNYGYVVFFLPMDGGTYTVERQTKTYVPKYESTSPKKHLWTRPKDSIHTIKYYYINAKY